MSLSFLVRFYFFFTAGETHEVFNNVLNIVENFTFSEKKPAKKRLHRSIPAGKGADFPQYVVEKALLTALLFRTTAGFPHR